MTDAVLEIVDLRVTFVTEDGETPAVDGVDLTVGEGEIVALCGESGCGKSVTCLAVMGLLGRAARVSAARVALRGRDLIGAGDRELREVRGAHMGMVFQDAGTALNPYLRVGVQLTEGLRLHRGVGAREARSQVVELLGRCGIHDPGACFEAYPHELSGGMKQRVLITAALALEPDLVLADEPTTALDVTTQAQVLRVLRDMVRSTGSAMVFVTHDLGAAAAIADRLVVLYAGRVVEDGPIDAVLGRPAHPYTRALKACLPRVDRDGALASLPGMPPRPGAEPGCPFAPRCDLVELACREELPPMVAKDDGRRVACPISREATP